MWFEKLIELIQSIWTTLLPFEILDEFEGGCVLRLGKFSRLAVGGWNWKWPLAEKIIATNVVFETSVQEEQHLTTQDGVSIGVSVQIGYEIHDVQTFLLHVEDSESVISDSVMRVTADMVRANNWSFIQTKEFKDLLKQDVSDLAWEHGVTIETVGFVHLFKFDAMYLTQGLG